MRKEPKKILITGATGLVGTEIVKLCSQQNIAVHYLTTSRKKIVSREGYSGFYWNPDNNEIDLSCLEGVTDIINLAGSSISKRWTKTYKKEVLSSRVNSLRTLYKGITEVGAQDIRSFVSASAIGIYPNSITNYYTEEEGHVDKSFLGEVVKAWEEEIDTFRSFSFNVAKIRIGLVLSENGGALPEMAKPIKNYVGAAFGSGNQWQSWIHIQDLARAFLFGVSHSLEGTFNGVGPNPVTNSKLTKQIATTLHRPLFLPNIPQFFMKLILGEMSYILFASQRVSSKKIEEEGFIFNFTNVCSAISNIYGNTANEKECRKKAYEKEFV